MLELQSGRAQPRSDVAVDRLPVRAQRRRRSVGFHVLGREPHCRIGHGDGTVRADAFRAGILASRHDPAIVDRMAAGFVSVRSSTRPIV